MVENTALCFLLAALCPSLRRRITDVLELGVEVQHGKLRQGDSKLSRIPDSRISKSSRAIKPV